MMSKPGRTKECAHGKSFSVSRRMAVSCASKSRISRLRLDQALFVTPITLLNRYGRIEKFPSNVLGKQRDLALLFKKLATLRTDAPLFKKVETLRWRGATPEFSAWADRMEVPRLLERCVRVKLRQVASEAAGR